MVHHHAVPSFLFFHIFIPVSGCVGRNPSAQLCPGNYNAVKTALPPCLLIPSTRCPKNRGVYALVQVLQKTQNEIISKNGESILGY